MGNLRWRVTCNIHEDVNLARIQLISMIFLFTLHCHYAFSGDIRKYYAKWFRYIKLGSASDIYPNHNFAQKT